MLCAANNDVFRGVEELDMNINQLVSKSIGNMLSILYKILDLSTTTTTTTTTALNNNTIQSIEIYTYFPLEITPYFQNQGNEKVNLIENIIKELNVTLIKQIDDIKQQQKETQLEINVYNFDEMAYFAIKKFEIIDNSLDLETCKLRKGCTLENANEKPFWDIYHPSHSFHKHMSAHLFKYKNFI